MPEPTTVLIANRGEIARRVTRTARQLGLRVAVVFADPDRHAPFVDEADFAVRLPGTAAVDTYLNQDAVLAAARRVGANLLHPGYGFLAENAGFAEACAAAGITFVGPPAAAIRLMGDKVAAKEAATDAGVPVLPGAEAEPDHAACEEAGRSVGYPLLVKAAAGGGGRGMRLVTEGGRLAEAVEGARREAASAFGDPTVFLERYVEHGSHVEVQVMADQHGAVVHLYERDCSVQRRHQKVVEESPSPAVDAGLREQLGAAAVRLASGIGYVGAGTVEFLVEGDRFFFLEMNTRLQVEHPVTEAVCGVDLVRLQFLVAAGRPLPMTQADITTKGHAIEVRIYAEDPARGYLPTFGRLDRFQPGPTSGVRWDSGVEDGTVVGTAYDPLLAKVIAHAPERGEAAARLARALAELQVHGVETNRDLLVAILRDEAFLGGTPRTDFLDRRPHLLAAGPGPEATRHHVLAATVAGVRHRRTRAAVAAFAPPGWRNVPSQRQRIRYASGGHEFCVEYEVAPDGSFHAAVDGDEVGGHATVDGERVAVEVDGEVHAATVQFCGDTIHVSSVAGTTSFSEVPRHPVHGLAAASHGATAPVPGTVVAVMVEEGQRVQAGELLLVLEAMKMEHRIVAVADGVVAEIRVAVGDAVEAHQSLVVVEDPPSATDS